ncbi:MAG: N-6 DNA methylase [Candidatus Doudnabacteria bacterium]|nr:N-6 DNA methylase [Candidatus Doudnabacteria bacterium]
MAETVLVKKPEHNLVRLPLVKRLVDSGWSEAQIQFQPEWAVPKSPSEASKREAGHRFLGFPVDIAIFDTEETLGQWEHVLIIFELKAPNKKEGRNQLEIYLSLEPRAKVGYWTNGTESLALYRRADGTYKEVINQSPPGPYDNLSEPAEKPLTWADLQDTDVRTLRSKLERLLGSVAASDTRSTRPDDRLNQLCNLLLVKLESDRVGKFDATKPIQFQVQKDETSTADNIRKMFISLRVTHPSLFIGPADQELYLDDHTIQQAVYELSSMKLMDANIDVVSHAFQIFRSASLKSEEGQYFTPKRVIDSAVKLMDISHDDKVLDPACGTGGFLLEVFSSLEHKYPSMPAADLRTWAHQHLYGVDKDAINVKLSKAIMAILGDGSTNIHVGDSLRMHRWEKDYPLLVQSLKKESFSCIITNPPFGEKLKVSKDDARRSGYTIAAASNGNFKDLEIGLIFLEQCYNLLAPGGRLGIVLPETYFFSANYAWIFNWLDGRLELKGMFNIPMEAFQGFCRAKTNFYVFERLEDAQA